MELSSILAAEAVRAPMKASSKKRMLQEMAGFAASVYKLDETDVFKALQEREGDGVSNYAPFTAALNAPDNEGTVTAGTINLSWTGGDTNPADSLTYDLFFGETTDPALLEADLTPENFDVTATAGTTYYWKIDTSDDHGVKTLGQIWTFTVN